MLCSVYYFVGAGPVLATGGDAIVMPLVLFAFAALSILMVVRAGRD